VPNELIRNPNHTPSAYRLILGCAVLTLICALPLGLMALGIDFATQGPGISLDHIQSVTADELLEMSHQALRGGFTHTIFEWTGVCIAAGIFVFSLIQYRLMRKPALLVIGIALGCAGVIDAFYTLAADRLIESAASNRDLISFIWMISRLFNGLIPLVCIGMLILWLRKSIKGAAIASSLISLSLVAIACLMIQGYTTPLNMPDSIFNGESSGPYDLLPLLPFLLCGLVVFPLYYKRDPSLLAAAIGLDPVFGPRQLQLVGVSEHDNSAWGEGGGAAVAFAPSRAANCCGVWFFRLLCGRTAL